MCSRLYEEYVQRRIDEIEEAEAAELPARAMSSSPEAPAMSSHSAAPPMSGPSAAPAMSGPSTDPCETAEPELRLIDATDESMCV